jgi:LmbE family N-acetylglucosaminyl deacetylase
MKLSGILLFGAVLLMSGCESMSSRVQERFSTVAPHTRIYAADQRTVYYAAQVAVKNAGLLLGRTSIARGSIDGYAPIRSGDAAQNARQTTIEIRLFETDALDTRVEVLVWEHQEGSFPGGVSEQALREHSLYENYYAALQQVLEEGGALKSGAKP